MEIVYDTFSLNPLSNQERFPSAYAKTDMKLVTLIAVKIVNPVVSPTLFLILFPLLVYFKRNI